MPYIPGKPFAIPNPAEPVLPPSGPPEISSSRERRRRPRVLLELPVRVRWLGPFGLETEITQTRNVSRGGLLVASTSPRQIGSLLWATFPYDAAVVFTESETPGKVVRCAVDSSSDSAPCNVTAIAFHQIEPHAHGDVLVQHGSSARNGRDDHRRHTRVDLAFLVRVERDEHSSRAPQPDLETPPWPEEAMTVDVSPGGMIFCTLRIYEAGEGLVIAAQSGRKLSIGRRRARVVRVARSHPDSPLSHVAVEFLS